MEATTFKLFSKSPSLSSVGNFRDVLDQRFRDSNSIFIFQFDQILYKYGKQGKLIMCRKIRLRVS